MVFFTADNHFGHGNIIRLCGRPFWDASEMDEYMISAWNGRVGENDDVYIAGDLIFRAGNGPETYLERLNGKKHLILGNHDRPWLKKISQKRYFVSVSQMEEIALEGKQIILCHYPVNHPPLKP